MMRNCSRCRKRRFILDGKICARCQTLLRRMVQGLCTASIHHGPGHQSTTYCEQKVAKHWRHKGRLIHTATYGSHSQHAEWTGREKCSGYFDEPPTLSAKEAHAE